MSSTSDTSENQERVFISYARKDIEAAQKLFDVLKDAGSEPYMDRRSLQSGQEWNIHVRKAVRSSRYFIPLLSKHSVAEGRGYLQRELREAFDILENFGSKDILVIPVRLDDCEIPYEKFRELEHVDLFPDWNKGIDRIINAMGLGLGYEFAIEEGDLIRFNSDAIALKYAQKFYGTDAQVADSLEKEGISIDSLMPLPNKYCLVEDTDSVTARYVLFIGVLPAEEFKYKQVREFASQVINIVSNEVPNSEHIAMTVHGVGFGLDELECFLAEFAGVHDGMLSNRSSTSIKRITIVDRNPSRVQRLRSIFQSKIAHATYVRKLESDGSLYQVILRSRFRNIISGDTTEWIKADSVVSAGFESQSKPHVFVAIPFIKQMDDIFYFGIQEPTHAAGFLCERVDNEVFVGEIMNQVKKKIETATAVIADLSGSNPNVYLEVGYAWGKGRPAILLIKAGEEAKFDVRGYRHLKYETIKDLKEKLNNELQQLKLKGEI